MKTLETSVVNNVAFLKTASGGQFFKIISENEVLTVSTYDFNPVIEKRQFNSAAILENLKCTEVPESEFNQALNKTKQLLGI